MPLRNVQDLSFVSKTRVTASVSLLLLLSFLGGCEAERRAVGPSAPLSAPVGPQDPRARLYATNVWQQSEGGRMFRWQGCDRCHGETSAGAARLTDDRWAYGGAVTELYVSIAEGRPGMPAYRGKVAEEQIWQMAGYVHGLPKAPRHKRVRQTAALEGEPQGRAWTGPLQ